MPFKLIEDVIDIKKKVCGIFATISCNNGSYSILDTEEDLNNFVDSIFEILNMYFEFVTNTLILLLPYNSYNFISEVF